MTPIDRDPVPPDSDSDARPGSLAWMRAVLDERRDLVERIEQGTAEDRTKATLLAGVWAAVFQYRAGEGTASDATQSYASLREKLEKTPRDGVVRSSPEWPLEDRRHDRIGQTSRRKPETPLRVFWYSLAAVSIAIAGIVIGWRVNPLRFGSRAPVMATYVTGNGQRASITLNDGTTVALDVASRLEVPADYMAGHRTLRLQGAAFFTVTHRDGAPFTVVAGGTSARVLGTSFVVRHYATDTSTLVAVRDGKVAVRSAIITGAQQAEVSRTGSVRLQSVDPTEFGFVTGVLTLNGVPFAAALPELDRWYNADIRLGDPALAVRHVAGEYAAGSLADLANILELTFDVRVVRDGRVLTLYPK